MKVTSLPDGLNRYTWSIVRARCWCTYNWTTWVAHSNVSVIVPHVAQKAHELIVFQQLPVTLLHGSPLSLPSPSCIVSLTCDLFVIPTSASCLGTNSLAWVDHETKGLLSHTKLHVLYTEYAMVITKSTQSLGKKGEGCGWILPQGRAEPRKCGLHDHLTRFMVYSLQSAYPVSGRHRV